MIETKNLTFSYGKTPFMHDLSLSFADGTLTAIIGENGSGKSTLLNLISGDLKPNGGCVTVDGKNVGDVRRIELARLISYFPQGRDIPDMTSLELVTLGRYPYIAPGIATPKRETDIALSALNYVGATRFKDVSLKKMSYGERQRVYLAMQIAQNAQNCLLDEPTSFLDVGASFAVTDILVRLKNEGKCVVSVIHDIALAMRCADRIILMKGGHVEADGSPQEVYESGKISDAFGVSIEAVSTSDGISYVTSPKKI